VVEQKPEELCVAGSIPALGISFFNHKKVFHLFPLSTMVAENVTFKKIENSGDQARFK
jgi:hypothetical protein